MGKPTGFMEYKRQGNTEIEPLERYQELPRVPHSSAMKQERQVQACRCMDVRRSVLPVRHDDQEVWPVAVHFTIWCPEWNDLVYHGQL